MTQPTLHPDELREVDEIAEGVWGKRLMLVNVYLVREGDRYFLVDAGLRGSREPIQKWVSKITKNRKPAGIFLTHGHFDHVGSLPGLARRWDVPVWAHATEQPYITGRSAYPPPDPSVGGGMVSLFSALYPKGPSNMRGRACRLSADGSVSGFDEWRWIATPGHSPGHVSYYRERDGVLLAGDAFSTTKQESLLHVLTQRFYLEGPPAFSTADWVESARSVERLAGLNVRVAAPGHGWALHGPAAGRCLEYLARHFDELAVPKQGRYVPKASAS